MKVITDQLQLSTRGNTDIIDITPSVSEKLSESKLKNGIVNLNVIGSTGALTTCEYEPGLVKDLKEFFEKTIPTDKRYHHDDTWNDGNGHSHLRASLVGPSLTVPFSGGELALGTWQQIIFIDFDNRPRQRKIIMQFMGDKP